MSTLHTFGCSITQGHALPDIVNTLRHPNGEPLTAGEVDAMGDRAWEQIHRYEPSDWAWPSVLAAMLDMKCVNHARRGACFNQIARQVAVNYRSIQPTDTVIVMWTYLSRISLQWPARTTVPFCTIVDTNFAMKTVTAGFNKLFGLSSSRETGRDSEHQDWIERSVKTVYTDPRDTWDRYYNSLVQQITVDGLLRSTGARVIHTSVETETVLDQLDEATEALEHSLRTEYKIPNPHDWYTLDIDYKGAHVIHDPRIPPAENDMHPSIAHHARYAEYIRDRYFKN